MWRKLMTVAAVLLAGGVDRASVAYAMGGNLSGPSIAIPAVAETGKPDPVAERIQRVLASHGKEFTGGYFLNAHSVLHFAGGAKSINALLDELSGVEGAVIHVRFSREAGVTRWFSGNAAGDRPCDCSIEHLGWGMPRSVSLTIYLGGQGLDVNELNLPAIQGRSADKKS